MGDYWMINIKLVREWHAMPRTVAVAIKSWQDTTGSYMYFYGYFSIDASCAVSLVAIVRSDFA